MTPRVPLYTCQVRGQADGWEGASRFIQRSSVLSMERPAVGWERCTQAAHWVNLVVLHGALCCDPLTGDPARAPEHMAESDALSQQPKHSVSSSECGCSIMTGQPNRERVAFVQKVGRMWTWTTHLVTFTKPAVCMGSTSLCSNIHRHFLFKRLTFKHSHFTLAVYIYD